MKDKTASLCNMYLNDLLKTDKVLAHKSIVVAIQIFATTLRRPRESGCYDSSAKHLGPLVA